MPARRLRPAFVAVASLALGAGLLVATPAQAASGTLTVSSTNVAVNSNGDAEVRAKCGGKGTCTGSLVLQDGTPKVEKTYKLAKGKSAWLKVKVHTNHPAFPHTFGPSKQKLVVKRKGASTVTKTVDVEVRRYTQTLSGTVNGVGPTPQDVVVKLWGSVAGRGTVATRDVAVANPKGGRYEFSVNLGRNNTSSASYRVEVTGTSEGQYRTWWWRGANGKPAGGGRYIRDASVIKVGKNGYTADVSYGEIKGTFRRGDTNAAINGGEVTVAAPPPSFSGGARVLRNLDYDSCANIFGTSDTQGGQYSVGFLPANHSGTDNRYMVGAESSSSTLANAFYGNGSSRFGSCLDITGYNRSRSQLIPLTKAQSSVTKDVALRPGTSKVWIRSAKLRGGKSGSDRLSTIRAYRPGRKILDSPIVRQQTINSNGNATYSDLAPGKYWVEVGRRTDCHSWMPSRFPNNRAYHKGVERSNERWQTVSGAKAEYSKSVAMGFPKSGRKPPKGYKGWMYRGYCRSDGAGRYFQVDVADGANKTLSPTVSKGATISGRVTRVGGKTNKEIMVTAYSTGGVLVQRTAITNGSGRFTIRGLASGNYRIVVNGDSWRGIGRTASGPKTKKVTAGRSYSVGTLNFKS